MSLIDSDGARQAKSLIFIVVPQAEKVPKVQKNKIKKYLKEMLLEPSFVMEQDNNNIGNNDNKYWWQW